MMAPALQKWALSGWRQAVAVVVCMVAFGVAFQWMYVIERENLLWPHEQGIERELEDAVADFRVSLEDSFDDAAFLESVVQQVSERNDPTSLARVVEAYLDAHQELRQVRFLTDEGKPNEAFENRGAAVRPVETSTVRLISMLRSSEAGMGAMLVKERSGERALRMVHRQQSGRGFILIDQAMESWAKGVERAGFSIMENLTGEQPHGILATPLWQSDAKNARALPAPHVQRRAHVSRDGATMCGEISMFPPEGTLLASADGSHPVSGWRIVVYREVEAPKGALRLMAISMASGFLLILVLTVIFLRSQWKLNQTQLKAARQIEAERARLELIIDRLPVPVFFQSGAGRLTMINRAFEHFLDTPRSEVLGGRLEDLLPEDESAHLLEWNDPLILNEDGSSTQETAMINSFGELRKVSLVVTDCGEVAKGAGPHQMIGAIIDNTEGVNAFQAMEDSLDLMTKVTSQVPGVVFEFKRRPDGDFCFPWASVGILQIFELSPLDVEDNAEMVFERIHPDDRGLFRSSVEASGEALEPWKLEFRVTRSNGQIRWLLGNSVPERESDGSILWHGFITDVTDFKYIEEQLRDAKAEAEQANRAKSAFLAAMSHEIRTPMNGVIGMTSLLSQTELNEEQAGYVHTIRHSGDALLVVINDILDFSKIESGRLELEMMPFDLAECVEGVVDILAPQAVKKQLAMAYYIDETVPLKVMGDVTRVRQILVNLVGNAIKFTTEGEVFINVDMVERDGGDFVRVTVEDTGAGIPSSRMDRLFKPFSQVDSSTNRIYGGTGLGLAISKRLTELMEGDLFFESTEGEGSSFYFLLPVDEVAMGSRVSRFERVIEGLQGKRVLIADSRALHRVVISSYLNTWGLNVREAPDTSSLLNHLNSGEALDAVLVDRGMLTAEAVAPEQDALRSRRRDGGLKVILMDEVGRSAKGEWDAFLAKPIKAVNLGQTLRLQLLEQAVPVVPKRNVQESSPEIPGDKDPLRILLAEDNRVNQKVATMILGKLGYKADIANNGREAYEACQAIDYDVVLMDVQMPEMDGLEATRAIREHTADLHQPWIIALTANATTADRDQAIENGMNDYLAKPVKIEDLRGVIAAFIERRNQDREQVADSVG